MDRMNLPWSTVRKRLFSLIEHGLISSEEIVAGQRRYKITEKGLSLLESYEQRKGIEEQHAHSHELKHLKDT
jgi:predicted transcriptional regulator